MQRDPQYTKVSTVQVQYRSKIFDDLLPRKRNPSNHLDSNILLRLLKRWQFTNLLLQSLLQPQELLLTIPLIEH